MSAEHPCPKCGRDTKQVGKCCLVCQQESALAVPPQTATCLVCGGKFEYMPVLCKGGKWRKRQICDGCRERNLKQQRRNWRTGGLRAKKSDYKFRGNEGLAAGVFKMSRQEIARQLHLNESTVEEIERRALSKIRNSTELRELWASFVSDGCPIPHAPADPAGLLLDYQLAVADWWALHDKIAAVGGTAEALECLREIAEFQEQITHALNENSKIE